MPNCHCPQPCAIMILSFFSKSMSDTAITHITLKWSQYGHLVDGSEILPTSRGWLKYLIGPQPVFFYTESFWSINSSKATPVLPFPRGRTAPFPSPHWESSSWLVERIAKAVWVPRARNTSNGNAEVMVVDEVHKTTRMLDAKDLLWAKVAKLVKWRVEWNLVGLPVETNGSQV